MDAPLLLVLFISRPGWVKEQMLRRCNVALFRRTREEQIRRIINKDFPWLWGAFPQWDFARTYIDVSYMDEKHGLVVSDLFLCPLASHQDCFLHCEAFGRESVQKISQDIANMPLVKAIGDAVHPLLSSVLHLVTAEPKTLCQQDLVVHVYRPPQFEENFGNLLMKLRDNRLLDHMVRQARLANKT